MLETKGLNEDIRRLGERLRTENLVSRLCAHDVTLWPADEAGHAEIARRLDWLEAPITSLKVVPEAINLRDELLAEGFTHVVVLGMGGSSLAPEVYGELARGFDVGNKGLNLSILDSTSPDQVLAKRNAIPLGHTFFILSSKSGSTSEMEAGFHYFWTEMEKNGYKKTGGRFAAITDPGTRLEALGKEKNFRRVFQANPHVGGRYSALIEFGIIPAVLAGIDGERLLNQARSMMLNCSDEEGGGANSGIELGLALGAAYQSGRDKLALMADSNLAPISAWIEQLVAESSGKNGQGILPIANEPLVNPEEYGHDRIFVYLSSTGGHQKMIDSLVNLGHPAMTFHIDDFYQLGSEFYRWELAIAIVCSLMGINAFDQPDVQLTKELTREMVAEYKRTRMNEKSRPFFSKGEILFYGDYKNLGNLNSAGDIINSFVGSAKKNGFIAINAFVARNDAHETRLQAFRKGLMESTGLATTLGFGPRFLHSTGQYHKGGKNDGLFLLMTTDPQQDIEIPGEGMTFGALLNAQAIGDMRALQQQNRRVLRIHFKNDSFEKIDLRTLI